MFKNRDLLRILVTHLAVLVAIVTGLGVVALLKGAQDQINASRYAERALER
ncbi:conserved hypothetical protein [Hyphomicrobium denitrificans ATCC 51888]|uniref:Uncharacterized protein n=1 Tax=Hyphomicrobium denitrificans (strain ATCC 51888 / DSM 1869 / NCIMB 11706 / TK 0415) TaxID=582899 RepID=D8JWA7_HYPDA|nr:hypothetical protein [Hyphomicrobium denitrificans]ADJ23020.1 conserved hypothetical protein [Hyphomicrobium denitrificans ATCC 51888]